MFIIFARPARTVFVAAFLHSMASAFAAAVTVVDAGDQPVKDAVVSVVMGSRPVRADASAAIAQAGRRFDPTVTVVQTGTPVSFPNMDTVRHHVYSFSPAKRFEIKLYIGTPTEPVVFDKPGIVTLGCNIHDRMLAWVVVVDSPYFAKTDSTGTAQLAAPPGRQRLRIWHPALGETTLPFEQEVALDDARPTTVKLPR